MTSIEGYSDYLIFEDGEIFSLLSNKLIKRSLTRGYYQVGLYKNNVEKKLYLHRLIALTFIPNPENKPVVDHIDENKLNNNISNLRWVTHSENCQNIKKPRKKSKIGEKYIYKNIVDGLTYYYFKKTINGKKFYKFFKNMKRLLNIEIIF